MRRVMAEGLSCSGAGFVNLAQAAALAGRAALAEAALAAFETAGGPADPGEASGGVARPKSVALFQGHQRSRPPRASAPPPRCPRRRDARASAGRSWRARWRACAPFSRGTTRRPPRRRRGCWRSAPRLAPPRRRASPPDHPPRARHAIPAPPNPRGPGRASRSLAAGAAGAGGHVTSNAVT
jgi:hypothetical protein